MSKEGRPSKYKKEFSDLAYKFSLLGSTDKQLAEFLGISKATLNGWKKNYPEFLDSLKRGKDFADAHVADSLYKRATGYNAPDIDIKVIGGKIVKTELIKHYPPDPVSMIYWLNNRQRNKWSNRHQIELDFDRMSEQEIDELIVRLIDKAKKK